MASLRDQIAEELVDRLDAIAGWTAVRGSRGEASNVPILAIVYQIGESKRAANTEFYACSLRLGVVVRSGVEHADDTLDAGNPQRYLDRLIVQVEQAVHGAPWANEAIVSIEGHEIAPPGDQTVVEALVTVAVDYRHNFDNPEVYAPHFTDA